MGERLVVEIKRNNNTLATAYYHWSAYTSPALNILDSMYTHVLSKAKNMTDSEIQLALIRFAENTTGLGYVESEEEKQNIAREFEEKFGESPETVQYMLEDLFLRNGGLDPKDLEFAQRRFPGETFKDDVSRNEGLIDIAECSMQEAFNWAECLVTIDLDDGNVLNGAIYEYDIVSYLEEMEDVDEEDYVDPDSLPKSPINLSEFKLDEIPIVKDVVEITQSDWIRHKDIIYQLKTG